MLWVKAFHIVFVIGWMAGLLYLPRIFVNLALVPADGVAERDRLLLMGRKLYRFSMWLSVFAVAFGLWLLLGFGISGAWLYAKLVLVVLLVGYHHYCGALLKQFARGANTHSHAWYRVFNEIPALALLAIVVLVVVKPF